MPLFQHRHHCALAKALEEVSDVAETAPVINALICALQRDTPRFDAERVRAACAGQPTPKDADPHEKYMILACAGFLSAYKGG